MTTTNWGIIGLGKIAHKFVQDLRLVPEARLHAVASTDGSRAQDFAKQYGASYFFSSYEAMLNCPHLDVVYIATPHVLHCPTALMFLRKRIPVLCEKPFAMNGREVRMMIETAQANQTFLMEAMWTRFIPSFRKAMELVDEGVIGTPLSIKSDFGFAAPFNPDSRIFNKNLGGGSLLDIGIYPVMAALSFFGKPDAIHAMATIGKTGVDEICSVQCQYRNGAIALCHSAITYNTSIDATIYGEKGNIYLPSRWHHAASVVVRYADTGKEDVFHLPHQGFGYQFEAMEVQKCLKNNQIESAGMSHQFSLDLIDTLDAIRQQIGLVYNNE